MNMTMDGLQHLPDITNKKTEKLPTEDEISKAIDEFMVRQEYYFQKMDPILNSEMHGMGLQVSDANRKIEAFISTDLTPKDKNILSKEVSLDTRNLGLPLFRLKLFTGGYPELSEEVTILLQRKVIEVDQKLAEYFKQTITCNNAEKLNNQDERLLNKAEAQAIFDFDIALQNNPIISQVFKDHFSVASPNGGALIAIQQQRMERIFQLNDKPPHPHTEYNRQVLQEQLNHVRAVALRVREYTGSPVQEMLAICHDFVKHSRSKEWEEEKVEALRDHRLLELLKTVNSVFAHNQDNLRAITKLSHEVLSSDVASGVNSKVGLLFCKLFGLPLHLIIGLEKLSYKVISTHGADEFPRNMSASNPVISMELLRRCGIDENFQGVITFTKEELIKNSSLNILFSELYPVCQTPETVQLCDATVPEELAHYLRDMARVLNAADKMEGATPDSFVKYNLSISNQVLVSREQVSEYVQANIFASLLQCLNEETFKKLKWNENEEINQSITEMKQQAALLLWTCLRAEGKIEDENNEGFLTKIKRVFAETEKDTLIALAKKLNKELQILKELSEKLQILEKKKSAIIKLLTREELKEFELPDELDDAPYKGIVEESKGVKKIVNELEIKGNEEDQLAEVVRKRKTFDDLVLLNKAKLDQCRDDFNLFFKELLTAIKEIDLLQLLQKKGMGAQLDAVWQMIENPPTK